MLVRLIELVTDERHDEWFDSAGAKGDEKEARVEADKTKKAVKSIQGKVEKATLGDLGALADIKQKLQQEEQKGEPKEGEPKE